MLKLLPLEESLFIKKFGRNIDVNLKEMNGCLNVLNECLADFLCIPDNICIYKIMLALLIYVFFFLTRY